MGLLDSLELLESLRVALVTAASKSVSSESKSLISLDAAGKELKNLC